MLRPIFWQFLAKFKEEIGSTSCLTQPIRDHVTEVMSCDRSDVMPHSHCTVCPAVRSLLGDGTVPRSSHFIRVVHTTGRQLLTGHRFLTFNNSRITVLQMLVTEKQAQLTFGSHQTNTWWNNQYLNSPYVTLLYWKMTKSQPYVHRGPHLWLPY